MRKIKQNNRTATLDNLRDSTVSEELDSEGIEDLSRIVDSPDDDAELIGRTEHIMKSKNNINLILAYHQCIVFF